MQQFHPRNIIHKTTRERGMLTLAALRCYDNVRCGVGATPSGGPSFRTADGHKCPIGFCDRNRTGRTSEEKHYEYGGKAPTRTTVN
eukprot:5987806-Pyramimonas_sp.AAC.1